MALAETQNLGICRALEMALNRRVRLRGWHYVYRLPERVRTVGIFCSGLGIAPEKGQVGSELRDAGEHLLGFTSLLTRSFQRLCASLGREGIGAE